MKNPTLREAPVAELLAISDPLERAARITEYGRTVGTLPTVLADQRKADLAWSRRTLTVGQIAARVRLARSRIFRLAPLARPAAEEAAR